LGHRKKVLAKLTDDITTLGWALIHVNDGCDAASEALLIEKLIAGDEAVGRKSAHIWEHSEQRPRPRLSQGSL
jgi:hypothetical protein